MNRTWWQRNWAGFPVILAAFLGLGAFWYFLTWLPVHEGTFSEPHRVAEGEIGRTSGSEVSNVRSVWGSPGENEDFAVPDGANLLGVAVDIERTGDAHMTCSFRLSEQGGQRRVWLTAEARLNWTLFDTPSRCDTAQEGSKYSALAPFLLPADAKGPFFLEVLADDRPSYLQMAFTPGDGE